MLVPNQVEDLQKEIVELQKPIAVELISIDPIAIEDVEAKP